MICFRLKHFLVSIIALQVHPTSKEWRHLLPPPSPPREILLVNHEGRPFLCINFSRYHELLAGRCALRQFLYEIETRGGGLDHIRLNSYSTVSHQIGSE